MRATPSASRSPFGATTCGSSSTGWSRWPSPASATSVACRRRASTAGATTRFGVTEQLIFPEIDYDKVDASRGMDITIVTTARSDAEGKALLDAFGFPFRREGSSNHGDRSSEAEAAAQAQVQGAGLHPVPPVWPAALRVPQVRPLPSVPPASSPMRARSPASRRRAGERRRPTVTMTDPIADMLTRIRNANIAMHDEVKHAVLQAQGGPGRRCWRRRATSWASPSPTTPRARARYLNIDMKYSPERKRVHLRHQAGVQARPAGVPQARRGRARPRRPRYRRPVHVARDS